MPLNTRAHLASYDDLYEALISAHQGLSTEDSHAMNARLVLLLANHVGDLEVLREALRIARGRPEAGETTSRAGVAAITPVAPSHAGR
jgi:hypothetical protein